MVRFAVSLATDRDGFLRRSCASCDRDFKTEVNESELQWALAFQVQRMGLEIGADASSVTDEARLLRCPYCAFAGADQNMHTDETVSYLKRVILRECLMPQLNKVFSGWEDMFDGRTSGRLVSMRFEHTPGLRAARPFHGPEPPDMDIVDFICCGKKVKVSHGWTGIQVCVFCGADVRVV
jgi:hypothetical protein